MPRFHIVLRQDVAQFLEVDVETATRQQAEAQAARFAESVFIDDTRWVMSGDCFPCEVVEVKEVEDA